MLHRLPLPLVVLLLIPVRLWAQDVERPRPYPIFPSESFEQAVERGTRTASGEPGPDYWTNTAEYDIEATLSPETDVLRGTMRATYINRSPDTLDEVYVHLRQNLNAEGVVRNRPQVVTEGMDLSRVTYQGQPLIETSARGQVGYGIRGTVMHIRLPEPIPAGGEASFSFAWQFEVPVSGAPRMGQDGEVYYLGYWYPQFAVYDDLDGWTAEDYMGNGEFYMGYADYDVALTVPEGWLVSATGTLENPEDILPEDVRERLDHASSTSKIISIVGTDERGAGQATIDSPNGTLTWRYRAKDVRDFAWGTSNRYVWDATTARTGDDEDGSALVHALYRPGSGAWDRAAEFGQYAIEHLSNELVPYPYPHMAVLEGVIGGGMEYPMITLIGGRERSARSLFGTTYHEISHMWLPMLVGSNEKRYTWMDEGTTTFNTKEAVTDFWEEDGFDPASQPYYRIAGTDYEVEPMRHADRYPRGHGTRGIASYNKPALALHALRGLVGEEPFREAYHTYIQQWTNKHPSPYDLFNTFETVLDRDLDWFWRSLLYETWTLDHAVADVRSASDGIRVIVEDRGLTPMPTTVRVTYKDGSTVEEDVSVETWLGGARRASTHFQPGTVARVEIDPEAYLPDVDRTNNVWRPDS